MHTLAKKFMMARKLDFGEEGEAELLDDKVVLMDGSLIPEITKKTDDETAYVIGKSVGKNLSDNIRKTGISGSKMIEFMMDLLTMMGVGKVELHEFDVTTKKGEIHIENSITYRKCNGSSCSCSVLSGILAGVVSQSYKKDFHVEETGCKMKQADKCIFKIEPEKGEEGF